MGRHHWPTINETVYALGRLQDVTNRKLGDAVNWHRKLLYEQSQTPSRAPTIEDFRPTILGLIELRELIDAAVTEEMALAKRYASWAEIAAVLGHTKQSVSKRGNATAEPLIAKLIKFNERHFAPSHD